ncbi:MAG: CotH kinase family protein [Chitinophagales bacterium]|nr:CotH kinase family protein [Chitinophagales bacterium]MDW8428205.1 CotH kinase family protein [Chitinophagales bacterium]
MKQVALWLVSLCCLTASAQVVINEYSCSNRNIIADNFGDYEDYIELYNAGTTTVDLSGWYISDDPADPLKYKIPNGVSIAAGQFKLIWASNRNLNTSNHVHTNFRLTQTKYEHIVLSDASGNLIDQVALTLTQKNHSFGRSPNGSSNWVVFTSPTPNQSNGTGYPGYVAKPVADMPEGFYSGSVTITLTCSDPNATIHYTLDGSRPTTSSPVYTGPITLTSTKFLRARAFNAAAGLLPSFEVANTYFINVTHDPRYYILSLASGEFNALFNSWGTFDIDAYLEFYDKDRILRGDGEGKVDPHGNDSWAFPQKGIDFEMEDDYGYAHNIPYKIFTDRSRPSFDHLILKAGASDNYPFSWGTAPCHMRDAFVHTLALRNNLEMDLRANEHAIVYINGQYWGIYEVREKMDEPDFTEYYYDQEEDKIDILAYWGGLNVKYGSDTAWVNLYNFIMNNSMAVQANYEYVKQRLNLQSVIDYMMLNTFLVNCDWINWNTMWWRGRDLTGGRTKWTYSLWDEDNVLGLGQNYSGWPTTSYTADPCDLNAVFNNAGPSMGHLDILDELLKNDEFKAMYVNRYAELLNTVFTCDNMIALKQEFVDLLSAEMPGHTARWGGSVTGWQNNLSYLENFMLQRCAAIAAGIVDCYQVTGPYQITVDVYPAGAGTVTINTYTPTTYPWSGSYYGNINLGFKAKAYPNNNMVFSHWLVNNNVINPGPNVDSIFLNLTSDDVVTAVFKTNLPEFAVTFDVVPAGSGTLIVEGTSISNFPYSATYLSGTHMELQAVPATGYQFDYWSANVHYLNPNSTSAAATFALFGSDQIIAHFEKSTGISNGTLTEVMAFPTLTHDRFTVAYRLLEPQPLQMRLLTPSGLELRNLTAENPSLTQPGQHRIEISLNELRLPAGMYLLEMSYPGFHQTFKMVLLPQ